MLGVCFWQMPAQAQNLTEHTDTDLTIVSQAEIDSLRADSCFRTLMRQRMEGVSNDSVYATLRECYENYATVLDTAVENSPLFLQGKQVIFNVYPMLQNAAVFYSQKKMAKEATFFAQAFIDVRQRKEFKNETFPPNEYYPTMAYFAASNTFNAGDYERAVKYFRVYLNTKEEKHRRTVFIFMAEAYGNLGKYDHATEVFIEANANYPNDFELLSRAINNCIKAEDNYNLQNFVTQALAMKPGDETLLNIQGKLYEDTQDYHKALDIYKKMLIKSPESLSVNRHIALNYYNIGVVQYTKAVMETDEATAKRHMSQSKQYFDAAATTLENILASDPGLVQYMQALALAYGCMGDNESFEKTNARLASLGVQTVSSGAVPTLMNYEGKAAAQKRDVADNNSKARVIEVEDEGDRYSVFAKEYVESHLRKWQAKDPYETVAEYQERVTTETRLAKAEELKKAAENEYIHSHVRNPHFNEMVLKPYDAENRVFLVESRYGELIVPVPRENNEAKIFENSWRGMQFKDPDFYISNDRILLESLTFITPAGKVYRFEGDKNLNYVETVVDISFDPLGGEMFAQNEEKQDKHVRRKSVKVGNVTSEVDKNIPQADTVNAKTFAVIIANENYYSVAHVPMALHDGEVFGDYCKKTLGLPENNVRIYKDASYGVMIRAVREIREIASAYAGDIQIIFYYAGHGVPNESTKEAYLLPVDADAQQTEGCYSLNRLYDELGQTNANSCVVFLDACFSGAGREGDMLAEARGVALRAKASAPKGNMVIFSAASDDETALPYQDKGHGLFTYFLLKKLQDSKGHATLEELGNYITTNVQQQSVVVNHKRQTPSVVSSSSFDESWRSMRLNGR